MTKQPARIQVKETQRYYGDFEGSLESMIASLQSELDAGWEGIESEYEWDYGGEKYYLYGKSPSEETKRKLSKANKDKKWWNNGKGNTKFSKECPGENWVPGRGKKKLYVT
jgi:hypothetical protein